MRQIIKRIFLITAIALSFFLGIQMVVEIDKNSRNKNKNFEARKKELLAVTRFAAGLIDEQLYHIQNEAQRYARELTEGKINHFQAMEGLEKMLDTNHLLYSVSLAYEPGSSFTGKKLCAPLIKKVNGQLKQVNIEDVYNYTDKNEVRANWYTSTIKNGEHWVDPFYGGASKNILCSYSTPFYKKIPGEKERKPIGVVLICLSVDYLSDFVKSLDLGPSGYGAIVSNTGRYFVHPIDNYIISGKTIYEIGVDMNDETRIKWWNIHKETPEGIFDHKSTTTGLASLYIYTPIKSVNFSLHNTVLISNLIDIDLVRKGIIDNIVHILLFIVSVLISIIIYKRVTNIDVWVSSVILTVSLIFSISLVWHVSLKYHPQMKSSSQNIINETTRNNEVSKLIKSYKKFGDAKHYEIPTGVYIDDIRFTDKVTITILGTVWQYFDKSLPENLPKNIIFPDAEILNLELKIVQDHDTYLLYKWDFKVDIKQKLDYSRYPLNYERIYLKIHQAEGDYKVIPVPDIKAYSVTAPTSKPGIKKNLVLPGWEIKGSSFLLYTENLDANFGHEKILVNNYFPALSFEIDIKRKFIDVFISNLSPIILVLLLLFLGLIISNTSKKYKEIFKTSLSGMIGFYSGLLFIVSFAHIGIRAKVYYEGLFLLEYFYLFSYGAFLYVIINTIIFSTDIKICFIQFRDNLIYKILFWPLILISILIVSIAIFY